METVSDAVYGIDDVTLSTFLGDISDITTTSTSFLGSIFNLYTSHPALAIMFTLGIIAFVASIAKR